jgi:FixJ family two-component response regulator
MNIGKEIAPHSNMPQSHPVVSVVDSEAAVRRSMRALIEGAGWRAQTFASASEFLTQPRLESPNCLLLDVQLPDISGLDLQSRMAHRPETPIIFTTGFGDVAMTVRAMKAGAIEFLTKPVRDDVVMCAMEYAVGLSAKILRRECEVNLLRSRYE